MRETSRGIGELRSRLAGFDGWMNAAGFHEVPFRAIARSRGPRALLFFRVRPKPFVSSVSFSLPLLRARATCTRKRPRQFAAITRRISAYREA